MPRCSITSRLRTEKKPLSALTCRGGAALACDAIHHGHQQSVVVPFAADLLCDDKMIVTHRQRRGVTQRESSAVVEKAALRVGARKLAHPGLLQPLEPHGNV